MARRTLPPLKDLRPLEYCYAMTRNLPMVFRSTNGKDWEYWDKNWWSPGEFASASYYGEMWFRTEFKEWVAKTTKIKARIQRKATENFYHPNFSRLMESDTRHLETKTIGV